MVYVCDKCTAVFLSDEAPESCPRCNNKDYRRADDRELMNIIGKILLDIPDESESEQ